MPARRGTPGQTYAQVDPYSQENIQARQANDRANGNPAGAVFGPNGEVLASGDSVQTYGTWGSVVPTVKSWGGDAYNWAAGNPRGQKEAYEKAAQGYQDLGNSVQGQYGKLNRETQDMYNPAQSDLDAQRENRPTQQNDYFQYSKYRANQPTKEEQYLDYYKDYAGKKTNQENLLETDAYGNGPTDIESLYQMRLHGGDPSAAYEDARASEALNNQFAARGGYNSGAANRGLTDYYANANAQRSKQLADLAAGSSSAAAGRADYRSKLAGGADTSRGDVNRDYYNASAGADTSRLNVDKEAGNAAAGASGEQKDYYNNLTDRSIKLASERAGVNSDLGTKAIEAYKSGQVASIQAYLARAGVDAKAIAAFTETLKTGVEIAGTAGGG